MPPYLCAQVKVSAGTVSGCQIRFKSEAAGVQNIQVSLPGTSVMPQSIRVETLPPKLGLTQTSYGFPGSQVTMEADTRGFANPPELFWNVRGATYVKDGNKIILTLPQSGTVSIVVSGAGQTTSSTVYVIKPEIYSYNLKGPDGKIIFLPGVPLSLSGSGIPNELGRWKATGGTFTDDAGGSATFTPPTEPGKYSITYFHKDAEEVASTLEFEVDIPEFTLSYEKSGVVGNSISLNVGGLSANNCSQLKLSKPVYGPYSDCHFSYHLDKVGEHSLNIQLADFSQTSQTININAARPERPKTMQMAFSYDNLGLYWSASQVNLGDTRKFEVRLENFATLPQVEWSTDGGTITPSANGLTAIFTAPESLEGQSTQATYTVTATANGLKSSQSITVYKQPPRITPVNTYNVDSRPILWAGVPVKLYSDWILNTKGTWSSSSGAVTNVDKSAVNPSYRTETTFTPPLNPGPVEVTFAHDSIPSLSTTVNFEVVTPEPKLQTETLSLAPGESKLWRIENIPSYMCQSLQYKLDGTVRNFTTNYSWHGNYCDVTISGVTLVGQHQIEITIKDLPNIIIKGQLSITSENFKLQLAKEQRVHAGTSIRIDALDENGQPFNGDLIWKAESGSVYSGVGYANFYPGNVTGPVRLTAYLRSNPSNVQTITVESFIDAIVVSAPKKVLPGQQITLQAQTQNGGSYPLSVVWNSTAGEINPYYQHSNTTYFTAPNEPGPVRIVVQPYGMAEPVTTYEIEVVEPPKPPVLTLGQNLQSSVNILPGQRIPVQALDENGRPYQNELVWSTAQNASLTNRDGASDNLDNEVYLTTYDTSKFTIEACLKNQISLCSELPLNVNVNPLPPIQLMWNGETINSEYPDPYPGTFANVSARESAISLSVLAGEKVQIVKPDIKTDIPVDIKLVATRSPYYWDSQQEAKEILNVSIEKMEPLTQIIDSSPGHFAAWYTTEASLSLPYFGAHFDYTLPRIKPYVYYSSVRSTELSSADLRSSNSQLIIPGSESPFHPGPVLTMLPGEKWTTRVELPKYTSHDGKWIAGDGLITIENMDDQITFLAEKPNTLTEICYSANEYKSCLSVVVMKEGINLSEDYTPAYDYKGEQHLPYLYNETISSENGIQPIEFYEQSSYRINKSESLKDDVEWIGEGINVTVEDDILRLTAIHPDSHEVRLIAKSRSDGTILASYKFITHAGGGS